MRMGTFMIPSFLTLILILPVFSDARLINKCGTYYAEGYYTEIESPLHHNQKKKAVLLERNSNSEIKFFVSNQDIQKLIPDSHIGVNFKMKLNFESSCFYACEGKIIEVIEPLDPFQSTKPFLFPHPSPLNGTEVQCKPNSFETMDQKEIQLKTINKK